MLVQGQAATSVPGTSFELGREFACTHQSGTKLTETNLFSKGADILALAIPAVCYETSQTEHSACKTLQSEEGCPKEG